MDFIIKANNKVKPRWNKNNKTAKILFKDITLGPGALGRPRGSGWRGRRGDRDGEHM